MFKTNRLIRGELNKTLMRPILYMVTLLLVVSIIFSFTRFDINTRADDYYTISGNTKAEVYNNFYSTTADISKMSIDKMIQDANATLDYYTNLNTLTPSGTISPDRVTYNLHIDNVNNHYKNFYYQSIQNQIISQCNYNKANIQFELQDLRTYFTTAIEKESPSILITQSNSTRLITLIDQCIQKLTDKNQNYNNLDTHQNIYNYIFSGGRIDEINKILGSIHDVLLSENTIKNTRQLLTTAQTNLQTRENKITQCYINADTKITDLKKLVLEYYLYADQIALNFDTTLLYDPIKSYDDTYIHTLKGKNYSNLYTYQLQETLTSSQYLISHNATHSDYATMYNTNMASTNEPNAFDFVFSGMELCSFIIIIFCVVIAASMVAGEQSNGTLKLLAIRPYKRHKILSSKILSALIIGTILSLFCMLVLFALGWINFGIDLTNILAIFNATTPFVISPILVMLIYLGCLMLKILAYILIAVAISVIFRSNVGAVGISIFIFFFSTLFGYMLINSTWYAYLPFSNFDLFKYLGGNFVSGTSISTLSSTGILFNTDFFFSLIITMATITLLTIISHLVFKKREIK